MPVCASLGWQSLNTPLHPLHRAVGTWPVQHTTYRYRATRLQSSTPQDCWDLICPTHHLQIQGHTAASTPQGCWGLACPTHHLQIQGHTATAIHSTGLLGPGLSNTSLTDTGPHRCIHSTGLLGPGLSNTPLTDTGPHGYSHPLHRAVGAWPVKHITYRYRATPLHPLHRAVGTWPVQHTTYRYRATRLQSSTPQDCWGLACPTHHLQIQGHTATSTPQGCWDLACPTHHLQIQGHTATVIYSTGLLGPGLSNTPLTDTGPHGYSHPLHRAVGTWPVQHTTYRYRATRLQSSTPQGCWDLACPTHHLQIQGHTATVIHSTELLGPGLSNTSLTDTGPHGYSHPLHRTVGAWPVQHITYRYRATRLQSSTPQGCWGLACPTHHLQIQGHTATVIHSTGLLGPGLSNTPLTDTGPHSYSHPLHRAVGAWPVQHTTYRYRATRLQSSTPQTLTK